MSRGTTTLYNYAALAFKYLGIFKESIEELPDVSLVDLLVCSEAATGEEPVSVRDTLLHLAKGQI